MPSALRIESHSVAATLLLGQAIVASSKAPLLLLLSGQLGGGKTHLTKGIAQALSACDPREVTSPTFTLLQSYGSLPRLYHIDLYRIDTPESAPEEVLDALEDRQAWVALEWADRHPDLIPPRETLSISVTHQGEESRAFELQGDQALLRSIAQATHNAEGLAPSALNESD